MKINELKIGDKIKCKKCYYNGVPFYHTPFNNSISSIAFDKVWIGTCGVWAYKSDIIAKLEPQYKEIPIEQDENYLICSKCNKVNRDVKMGEALYQYICEDCKPKSFKSDFTLTDYEYLRRDNYGAMIELKGCLENGSCKINAASLKGFEFEPNKKYTIEIKEKE